MGFKRRFCRVLGGGLSAVALSIAPAMAEELQDWAFDTSNSELTFSLSDQVFPAFFLLSEPPRLVLDIPETAIGDVEPEQIYSGTVRAIRVAQHTPENVRVVIELAPDIVLSPAQADIQFDDGGDGQRHWRFRPLLAGDDTAVTATANPTAPLRSSGMEDSAETANSRSGAEISLSASNLELIEQSSSSAVLPVDPYEADSSAGVVSVPPLEDLPEDLPDNDLSISTAAASDVPEIPPMTVPELEETGADSSTLTTVSEEAAPRQESLPNLDVDTGDIQPDGSVAAEPLSVETSQPTEAATDNNVGDDDSAIATSTNIDTTAAAPEAITPVSDQSEEEPTATDPPKSEVVTSASPTETALAPVEASSSRPADAPSVRENIAPQTIQQPAAERTIVQTAPPAPVPFGQPLPDNL